MKSDKTIIKKTLMEQFNFITNLLGIKDPNIIILDVLDTGTHKEIIAKLDYLPLNALTAKDKWLNMTSRKNQKFPI